MHIYISCFTQKKVFLFGCDVDNDIFFFHHSLNKTPDCTVIRIYFFMNTSSDISDNIL
jgi:hypothetical protein